MLRQLILGGYITWIKLKRNAKKQKRLWFKSLKKTVHLEDVVTRREDEFFLYQTAELKSHLQSEHEHGAYLSKWLQQFQQQMQCNKPA